MSLFQDLSRSRLWAWLRENKEWVVTRATVLGFLIGVLALVLQIFSMIFEEDQNLTPEQIRVLMADRDKLRVELGVTDAVLHTFFQILKQTEVPPEQRPARLLEIAHRHKQALERLAALETEDSEAQALISKAKTAIEAGDYGRAERLLDQAEQRELAGIQAAQAAVEQRQLSAAAVRAEQAELSLIQLRYRQAAERFAAAAELVPDSKPEQRLDYRERRARALYHQGDEKGDNAALNKAIRAHRDLLGAYPRKRVPLQWARTQNNLGAALATLGKRESGTARLEEAVTAFRAALQEYTRDRVPLQWAGTQNNLGNALQALGERESGTGRLEEAVTAFRAALQEYTRDRVPLQWATTQNNLGNALRALGERESGTARLEEAVAAYQAALQERTRDRVPLRGP